MLGYLSVLQDETRKWMESFQLQKLYNSKCTPFIIIIIKVSVVVYALHSPTTNAAHILTTDSEVDFCCWICVLQLESFLLHCLSSWSSSKRTYMFKIGQLKKCGLCTSYSLTVSRDQRFSWTKVPSV